MAEWPAVTKNCFHTYRQYGAVVIKLHRYIEKSLLYLADLVVHDRPILGRQINSSPQAASNWNLLLPLRAKNKKALTREKDAIFK